MNYLNFARPESALEMPVGYPCEECGQLCDETFCSAECEADAHAGVDCQEDFGDFDPRDDGMEYEDDGQPTEYEEWQDLHGGDDWDHGQYDEF